MKSLCLVGRRTLLIALGAALLLPLARRSARGDAWERLDPQKLQRLKVAVETLKTDRRPVQWKSDFTDYRALLHVHSHLSHDSHGTIPEIVKAAH